jgi:hypothetical protein
VEIKDILYDEIDKIGKNHIRTLLTNDISNSRTIIDLILNNCSNLINKDSIYEDEFVSFSEALLHFILTMSMIPAERKISIDDTPVDILVPNSKNLKMNNDNAIIIHFIKDRNENINETIAKLSSIQKNTNNIWIVCSSLSSSSSSSLLNNIDLNIHTFIVTPSISIPTTITTTTNNINPQDSGRFIFHFSEILIKIDEFLKKINYSGLKIF